MTQQEYNTFCHTVLSGTLAYINTQNMPARILDRRLVQNGNAVYKSAVASSAPLTLIYTPPGSGKTQLLYDRVNALNQIGVTGDKIMILSMNIAKTKQIAKEQNCIAMTFSEFTHNIFTANYPDVQLSDIDSVANMMKMSNPDASMKQFISNLSIASPQNKIAATSIWINQNLQDAINALQTIKKADYVLESIICQNMMYKFEHNPYSVTDILVNGVHNMPLSILCALLEYANRYHCNLFMTGYPDEMIYDFNMAYDKSMDLIASLSDQRINLIRLNQTSLSPSILNMLNSARVNKLDGIEIKAMDTEPYAPMLDIANNSLTPTATSYIKDKLANNEQILVLARSKSDLTDIESVIQSNYPGITVCDLTMQTPHTNYGTVLATHANELLSEFPAVITVRLLADRLYHALNYLTTTKIPYRQKESYKADANNLFSFITANKHVLGELDQEWNTIELIKRIIQIESDNIQSYINAMRCQDNNDTQSANIILSTIHSAIDIRCNNAIVVLRCSERSGEDALYHTALSRANKTEYIVFANAKGFKSKYQIYLERALST